MSLHHCSMVLERIFLHVSTPLSLIIKKHDKWIFPQRRTIYQMSTTLDRENDENCTDPDRIQQLIVSEKWDEVYEIFALNPNETCRICNIPFQKKRFKTYLHLFCSISETPSQLIELVASNFPDAISMPDTRYGDTPLHIMCRSSQISCEKVCILLRYCSKIDDVESHRLEGIYPLSILRRTVFGGTAFHSACHHNATLETIQALVHANPSILGVRTHEGEYALTSLWNAYIQTIPGATIVAKVLRGGNGTDALKNNSLFAKFWKKVEYLSTECFLTNISDASSHQKDSEGMEPRRLLLLHSLIKMNVPINMYLVALKINPAYAEALDADGNSPLHVLVENRPYRLKEKEAIVAMLNVAPNVALIANKNSDIPLLIAIRNKIPWNSGLRELVTSAADTSSFKDVHTGLYPFQLAASQGGKVAVETTYNLLRIRPYHIHSR